jgi:hypothetical protein
MKYLITFLMLVCAVAFGQSTNNAHPNLQRTGWTTTTNARTASVALGGTNLYFAITNAGIVIGSGSGTTYTFIPTNQPTGFLLTNGSTVIYGTNRSVTLAEIPAAVVTKETNNIPDDSAFTLIGEANEIKLRVPWITGSGGDSILGGPVSIQSGGVELARITQSGFVGGGSSLTNIGTNAMSAAAYAAFIGGGGSALTFIPTNQPPWFWQTNGSTVLYGTNWSGIVTNGQPTVSFGQSLTIGTGADAVTWTASGGGAVSDSTNRAAAFIASNLTALTSITLGPSNITSWAQIAGSSLDKVANLNGAATNITLRDSDGEIILNSTPSTVTMRRGGNYVLHSSNAGTVVYDETEDIAMSATATGLFIKGEISSTNFTDRLNAKAGSLNGSATNLTLYDSAGDVMLSGTPSEVTLRRSGSAALSSTASGTLLNDETETGFLFGSTGDTRVIASAAHPLLLTWGGGVVSGDTMPIYADDGEVHFPGAIVNAQKFIAAGSIGFQGNGDELTFSLKPMTNAITVNGAYPNTDNTVVAQVFGSALYSRPFLAGGRWLWILPSAAGYKTNIIRLRFATTSSASPSNITLGLGIIPESGLWTARAADLSSTVAVPGGGNTFTNIVTVNWTNTTGSAWGVEQWAFNFSTASAASGTFFIGGKQELYP